MLVSRDSPVRLFVRFSDLSALLVPLVHMWGHDIGRQQHRFDGQSIEEQKTPGLFSRAEPVQSPLFSFLVAEGLGYRPDSCKNML